MVFIILQRLIKVRKSLEKELFLTLSLKILSLLIHQLKQTDEQDAQTKLKDKSYFDDSWTEKDITINVSVQIGEIRILKKIRDKGNDFDLKITYQYYDGVLKEDTNINTGEDYDIPPEDPWAEQVIPPYISMIVNTGCGRYV